MTTLPVYEQILTQISQIPAGKKLKYITGLNEFEITDFSPTKASMRVKRGKKSISIPLARIKQGADKLVNGEPVDVEALFGATTGYRTIIETILAHSPNIGFLYLHGRKHLKWYDYPIHPLGETFNLDSDDWIEPEWALATVVYEVVVLGGGTATIPSETAKLLEKSTKREKASWQARIANIREARKPGNEGAGGFDGGPETRKRSTIWKDKYADKPHEVKALAVHALKPCPEAVELAAKLGLPSPPTASVSTIGTNVIFFGPPGTGKSHKADLRPASLPDTIRVLFHPEYTYNDFFGLYKPVVGSNPKVNVLSYDKKPIKQPVSYFDFVPGPLLLALAQAFASPQAHTHMIIDEINRGDCAGIFGDIFQLLDREPDGSSRYSITIQHEAAVCLDGMAAGWRSRGGKLFFPTNFTILATMNTSDQGLYPMDSAFKRRWEWESCSLSFDPVFIYLGGRVPHLDDTLKKWDWEKLVDQINSRILNGHLEDKQIGPWFIAPDKATAAIDRKAFGNKCLYYLWHDVFKDDQNSDYLPFNDKPFPIRSFQELQEKFFTKGVAAIFKKEIWQAAEISAVAAAPETVEPVNPPAPATP